MGDSQLKTSHEKTSHTPGKKGQHGRRHSLEPNQILPALFHLVLAHGRSEALSLERGGATKHLLHSWCSILPLQNRKSRLGLDKSTSSPKRDSHFPSCCIPSSVYFLSIPSLCHYTFPHGSEAKLAGGKKLEFSSTSLGFSFPRIRSWIHFSMIDPSDQN